MKAVTTQFQTFPGQNAAYEKYRVAHLRIVRDKCATTNRFRARDGTVCFVKYDDINPAITTMYDLWQTASGAYKFVSQTTDEMYYDSIYFNLEQNKVITLGRFIDERTASLAHAFARAIPSLRVVENAAQKHIEAMVQATSIDASSSTTLTLPDESSLTTQDSTYAIDPLEMAQLFFS